MTSASGAGGPLFWAMAYKLSEIVFAAEQDGCLAVLENGASLDDVARVTGWLPDSAAVVLHLLVQAGFAETKDGDYRLTADAARSRSLIVVELQLRDWHHRNASLARALRTQASIDPLDEINNPEFVNAFARAMALTARETALRIRKILRRDGSLHLLDLGGADGSVGAELIAGWAGVTLMVVDRPSLQSAFERRIADAKLGGRANFFAADLRVPDAVTEVVAKADVILLLNVAHLLPEQSLGGLLQCIRQGAKPGATLIVRELFAGARQSLGLTDLLLVDWLKCGTRFRDDAENFASRLRSTGFADVSIRSFPNSVDTFITAQCK
jgi:hypothetical protein